MSARYLSAVVIAFAMAFTCAAVPSSQAQSFGFATFTAVVNANGVTARGSGVQSSRHPGTGRYYVKFTRNVRKCAHVASPRGKSGGQASVTPVSGKAKQLRVDIFSKSGTRADLGFVLLVSCI